MTEQTEPSMEEILSSIRRILSTEEGAKNTTEESFNNAAVEEQPTDTKTTEDVMELTPDMLCDETADKSDKPNKPTEEPFDNSDMELLSEATLTASADRLNDLTERLITDKKPEAYYSHNQSLEDFVASLLRPYLKEWLDANLPSLVEKIVSKEVERLTKRTNL